MAVNFFVYVDANLHVCLHPLSMNVYYATQDFEAIDNAVVTIGTFDGVHGGHQKIFKQLNDIAFKNKGQSVAITFEPHPRLVLSSNKAPIFLLQTPEEKLKTLEDAGIQHVLVLPFTLELAHMHWLDFVKEILVNAVKTKHLVIGYDHHFGNNREGNIRQLEAVSAEFGFEVHEIPAYLIDETKVSSTKIRRALLDGDVKQAAHLLGRPYSIQSEVIKGRQIGRTIGFPTANILPPNDHKLIPAIGVYAVKTLVKNQWYNGMANIGTRPTFDGQTINIEVHLFDFIDDIYGQQIQINFVERLRNEIKFTGIDALVEQLHHDRTLAMHALV